MTAVPRYISYLRNKYVGVEQVADDCLSASTAIVDSFFTGRVTLAVSLPELEVKSVEGQISRSFNEECQQAITILPKVVGVRVGPGLTKKVDDLIGGADGCTYYPWSTCCRGGP